MDGPNGPFSHDVLAFTGWQPWAIFTMTVEHGVVSELDGLVDPAKLRLLDEQLAAASL
ncbi:MAG TPA: hypothetical protein VNG12_05210 [Acidimicrobiales bacterium]|nr:hypothetical protein [Acidimicrobiales bacterium]